MERPQNCTGDENKTPTLSHGYIDTDSEYVTFGAAHCGAMPKREGIKRTAWMKYEDWPVTGKKRTCLNVSCPFNTGVSEV